jgi:hypothetical protein
MAGLDCLSPLFQRVSAPNLSLSKRLDLMIIIPLYNDYRASSSYPGAVPGASNWPLNLPPPLLPLVRLRHSDEEEILPSMRIVQ